MDISLPPATPLVIVAEAKDEGTAGNMDPEVEVTVDAGACVVEVTDGAVSSGSVIDEDCCPTVGTFRDPLTDQEDLSSTKVMTAAAPSFFLL